jgi:hypothetical protein
MCFSWCVAVLEEVALEVMVGRRYASRVSMSSTKS